MCLFSGPVGEVSATRIFARGTPEGRQVLAYAMRVDAPEDVAMILPLPVAPGPDAVRFVDLSGYPSLFEDLGRAFESDLDLDNTVPSSLSLGADRHLPVVEVGRYVASYVPTVADFTRLDPRFRLPDGVLATLPELRRCGFAVFALRPGSGEVHPMAFSFARADRARLFFPTLHVHDGQVHERARFDHRLYCQGLAQDVVRNGWRVSSEPASAFVDTRRTRGLVDEAQPLFHRWVRGERPNTDIYA